MDIYSNIFTRKSCRKYDMKPLGAQTLVEIETCISGLTPLLPESELTHKILGPDEVKGLGICKAPHYLIISGKEQPLRGVCAGFLYQHVELYLYSKGYATRWLSGVKSKQSDPDHIAGFAFGKPNEPGTRSIEEFDRKPVSEIASGSDSRLEAVRLAPSGMNGQPWYFAVQDGVIHVYYKQSLGGVVGMMYHMTDVDVGLALCHMAVASEHEGKPFRFVTGRKDAPTAPKNFTYIGTVE
ncbi:MAG: hypothetical protein LUG13_09950 [Oscillospiraceae bacterium]|nr:hypothetical protein [Oscillospiraceae bacterium]